MVATTKQKDQIQLANELYAPIIRNFQRETIVPRHIDEIWSIDLMDMSAQSKYNDGYRYIFTCIDNFSKYAWAIPLKTKQATSTLSAIKSIFSPRRPKKVWVDRGTEFGADFKKFLKQEQIEIYSTHSDLKAVFVERFNGTLRNLLKVPVFVGGKARWIDELDTAMKKYNKRRHSTIKMSPIEGSKLVNEDSLYHLYKYKQRSQLPREGGNGRIKVNLPLGSLVRIPDIRKIFSKGDTTNWSYELFRVKKIVNNNPMQYIIEDESKEEIIGKNYQQELFKSKFTFARNRKVLASMGIKI